MKKHIVNIVLSFVIGGSLQHFYHYFLSIIAGIKGYLKRMVYLTYICKHDVYF